MRKGRFYLAALVLMVIGVPTLASANDGDPIRAGRTTIAYSTTTLASDPTSEAGTVKFADPVGAFAVDAENTAGPALLGEGLSVGSIGVLAIGANPIESEALEVRGTASFDRSGMLTVRAGASMVRKKDIDLDDQSMILATVQGNPSGIWVRAAAVTRQGYGGAFTIYLNRAATSPVRVAYFVLN